MYSSAVLAVAVASVASSTLAAPILSGPFRPINRIPISFNKFPVGGLAARQSVDASGALNTGLIKDVVDIGNGIVSGIDGIKSLFQREELELLARQQVDASGALNTGLIKDVVDIGNGIINGAEGIKSLFTGGKREEFEALVARQLADNQESGAVKINTGLIGDIVDIGNGIISGAQGIKDFFTGKNKRDFEDLLARQVQADADSGALGLGTIVKVGGALINGISSLFNNKRDFDEIHFAREYLDLMARQAPTDDSGALGLSTIVKVGGALINGISSLFNNKREFDEFMDIMARDVPADDSGALGLSTIFKVGGAIANGISSLFGNNKREEVGELFARAAVDADASGAFNIGNILKTVAGFILKREEMELLARDVAATAPTDSEALNIGNIVKTIAGFILKREEMELMARDAPADSEALNIGNILKTVAGFILKREEMEMLARDAPAAAPTDSEALNIGNILKTVAGIFLKREEEMMMARSLNELD